MNNMKILKLIIWFATVVFKEAVTGAVLYTVRSLEYSHWYKKDCDAIIRCCLFALR
jgi:hypothetical protein